MNDVRVCLFFLFVQSHPSVSLSFSFSLLQHLPDPMEIIIIQEEKREAQRDDEAEEKAINAKKKKRSLEEEEEGLSDRIARVPPRSLTM